ncbi:substrate-binding and VWA domain-containing protein [Saccharopolyspora sp. NPDC050389]|uniref:substrate-binding and VWA domain-containing protein n=1 Tax=Saccharopolyspora sp. NPDC050389 TaxID=3155516 RepID=UPI0033FD6882
MARLVQRRHVLGGIAGVALAGAAGAISLSTSTGCSRTETIRVSSSSEKAALMAELIKKYNDAHRAVGDLCARVEMSALTSGKMKNLLAEGAKPPEVWLPTSSMWLRLLEHEGHGDLLVPGARSITRSTLVIAMPGSVAAALEQRNRPLSTWADVLQLAQSGWSNYGKPDWDDFILGRDNAETSTSGLAATVVTYNAAPGELTRERLNAVEVQQFVRDIELSVSNYGDEAVQYMQTIYDQEQRWDSNDPAYRPYLDAVVIQEQMAYVYNLGAPTGDPGQINSQGPKNPLRAVHPRDGTLELDHPFVVMSAATGEQRAIAEDFYRFLIEPDQQKRFADLGFRPLDDATRPTDQLRRTLHVPADQQLNFVPPPDGQLLAAMLESWQNVRRKARVLLLLDLSGSMKESVNDPDTNQDPSKLQLMIPAAQRALDLLNVDDEVGLWTFSSNPSVIKVVPVSRVGDVREELKAKIQGLTAVGETALYQAIDEAYQTMTRDANPDRINAIVLLSDGANTEPYAGGAPALLAKLDPRIRETTIPIFTIPYGRSGDENIKTLQEISRITKATYNDTTNPLDIDQTFERVFRNFG